MIRKLIAKFNRLMVERVVSVRHKRAVPVKLSFVSGNTGRLYSPKNLFVIGETTDLSSSGIAFIVSSIRVNENYLVGEGRVLNAELDLPNGKVSMKIVGERYEQIGEQIPASRYLIGASIKEMTAENREAYHDFLRLSGKTENAGGLKFKVDEG